VADALVSKKAERGKPAEEVSNEDPAAPKIGRWYWVSDDDGEGGTKKWFGCVTRVGSNYVEITAPSRGYDRVHEDEFWKRCEHEPDPERVIRDEIASRQAEVRGLMDKVKEITARLAITTGPVLPSAGSETQALALRGVGDKDMGKYKKALVLAKEKTLPELFKEIRDVNEGLGRWLAAELIPMEAQAEAMEPAIEAIQDRIFSVELYAGLVEEIIQIRQGEPAPVGEKIRLMQRRCYCDEECLARYEVGGMEFKDMHAFDRWLAKKENMERILPFPRCVAAFQVRRAKKEREWGNLAEFLNIINEEKTDKFTYLYLRNGAQLFCLGTGIEFGEQLFPDMASWKVSKGGPLYAKMFSDRVDKIITKDEYDAMVEEEEKEIAEEEAEAKKHPEKDRWRSRSYFRESRDYKPFDRSNVHYDEMVKHVQDEMKRHNRLVLVLQGLLDRSPVFHPHPPRAVWTDAGFGQALELVYDDTRALAPGERPDFEAYRARLNASLKAGSITIGQEIQWEKEEAIKENARMDRDYRHKRSDYRPTRYRPYGNPGPGKLARVFEWKPKSKKCVYEWKRERQTQTWKDDGSSIRCTFMVDASKVFHVDAYKPGDFHQFFDDPRTRADYLEWAPFLLAAEEYHAGNRKAPKPLEPIPRRKTEDGAWKYRKKKQRKAWLGKAIRLKQAVTTQGGAAHEKGTLWRVIDGRGDHFSIAGIDDEGRRLLGEDKRFVMNVHMGKFELDNAVPPEPPEPEEEEEEK